MRNRAIEALLKSDARHLAALVDHVAQSGIRQCPHGYHHPPYQHSCDGCWCEGERDLRDYGWPHDTSPHSEN